MKIWCTMMQRNKPECLNKCGGWWRELWGLKVPPKLKMFWWQVARDILLTEGNLERHHVPISPACNMCGYSRASTIHAIFLCTKVRKAWKEAAIKLPVERDGLGEPIEFLDELYHFNPNFPKETFLALAWGIWKRRCDIGHKAQKSRKDVIGISLASVKWALNLVEEFKLARKKLGKENGFLRIKKRIDEDDKLILVFLDASFEL